MENFLDLVKILRFLDEDESCTIPAMRDHLEIQYIDPPSQELKALYRTVSLLKSKGYIEKKTIKKREKSGAHYNLKLTYSGKAFLKQIGISKSQLNPLERKKTLANLENVIRLSLLKGLSKKVSKPLLMEILSELTSSIINDVKLLL